MKNMIQHHNRQKGFTLLESLLALFVLTIGILGVAGMLLHGMRAGSVAMQRMVAVVKSQEIVERMRANVGYGSDAYFDTDANTRLNLLAYNNAVGVNNNCNNGTIICTPAQQAAHDIYMWQTELTALLPNSVSSPLNTAIEVAVPVAPSALYTVKVTIGWKDRNEEMSYITSLQI